ncbi:PREDICTED: pentatricopeptide repeat-containing protein At3g59040 isoform X1 [Tarenaya hassleriana]|uniref:pentatricopeptide repeat-containing protein At3g59040 isoform X1 n=2 Tax=Tarenaya hassleriana TaxID=28532 RepID=UPI00053CA67B|nr:PREDICTED: pentatricopeptide repeat-containing protein At3g59040 isoform X1 [Tarenaya hassleriana]
MSQTLFLKPFVSVPSSNQRLRISYICVSLRNVQSSIKNGGVRIQSRFRVVCMGMLAPRKFLQKRRKMEVFKDAADEEDQKRWRGLMKEIEETDSAVAVLRKYRNGSDQGLPRDLVLGTLVRFKQLKKWKLVSEILEWLRTQSWWNFNEMDFLMLITACGKLGDFNGAERVLSTMKKMGYKPNVISYTALMEAYGRGGKYNNAEAIFRRMQSSGPEPSALTYQIILKTFVEASKYKEAEEVFETLLNAEKSQMKPDQKMYHMMIYMNKKAGHYDKARKLFALMAEKGVPHSTVTYNSLMSFENNYKEVSKIYDQMQRAGLQPDVVSYALLVSAYGKARREEEALAVFEEMLDAGVRPTHRAYNILLDAFAVSGMVEQAKTVFKCMRRDRFYPDLCSYTTMLSAYVNACDMEGAEKFFKRLKTDGFEPNIITYGTMIKGYAKANDLEKIMEVYEKMRLSGIRGNQTILTTIMDAFGRCKGFGSAVSWYKEMETCGLPPDQKAKNVLLSLASTPDELEEAKELAGVSVENRKGTHVDGVDDEDDDEEDDDDDDDDDATKTVYYDKTQAGSADSFRKDEENYLSLQTEELVSL